MDEAAASREWFRNHARAVFEALRRDRVLIILAVVVVAAGSALFGKMTQTVKSSAQLVLTPLPLKVQSQRDAQNQTDDLAAMIAEPMDVKTAVLLCTSDNTYSETYQALNQPGALKKEIQSLDALRDALSFEITIEKETPYDLQYSPIIRLTAEGPNPADAKTMVDTWAENCVNAAENYLKLSQSPSAEGFAERAQKARDAYADAEKAYWDHRRKEYVPYYEARVQELIATIGGLESARPTLLQNVEEAGAKTEKLTEDLEAEPKTFAVKWTPSSALLDAFADKMGQTARGAHEVSNQDFLEIEQINENYPEIRGNLVTARADLAGFQAQLEQLDQLIAERTEELRRMQAKLADASIEDEKLRRRTDIYSEAYLDAAAKSEYAQMAEALGARPQLQILSQGAEWRMPRFRRAILFGAVGGFWALVLACVVSIVSRVVLKPLLEG